MSTTSYQGGSSNPELQAIAQRVLSLAKLSFQRASLALLAPNQSNLPAQGLERSAYDFMQAYQKLNRQAVARLTNTSRSSRAGVSLAEAQLNSLNLNLKFNDKLSLLEQAQNLNVMKDLKLSPVSLAGLQWDAAGKRFLNPVDSLANRDKLSQALALGKSHSTTQPTPPAAAKPGRELHLKLLSLKAIRRFGWEITDWGNDTIYGGGVATSTSGQIIDVRPFFIHTFKRDGENFNISPDKTFAKFDLTRGLTFPTAFQATLILCEQDSGEEFVKLLRSLWAEIRDQVTQITVALASAALGLAAGAVAGGAAGSVVPVLGTIVGAIVGMAVSMLANWLISSTADDIFLSPNDPAISPFINADRLFEDGATLGPVEDYEFTAGQSRYILRYRWEIVQ